MMQLHPIMYVADQCAERSFRELSGFEQVYEGEEFSGFWLSGTAKWSLGSAGVIWAVGLPAGPALAVRGRYG